MRHLAVRGGVEALWIQSVALAPAQIPMSNLGAGTAGVDANSGLFYYGGFVGLEASY
jgi:hypothetical protein